MPLHLELRRGKTGPWSLSGLPRQRAVQFDNLADGLDYAERQCHAAPAIIEFVSDGIYVAVSQEEGWPHQLCRSTAARRNRSSDASPLTRFGDLVRRCAARIRPPF